ncbi:MAG: hypothetical protein JJE52_01795 [Acidimicrobiia bacterium]|nr:hypothetical protein [Acidimicrobiia bacterium]
MRGLGRRLPPESIDADLRRAFGLYHDDVQITDTPPPHLMGAAQGDTVALAPEARGSSLLARAVAAHELAHLADRGGGGDHETRADSLATAALSGQQVANGAGPRSTRGLELHGCDRPKSAADRARAGLDRFAAMSVADREAFVAANYRSGSYAGTIRTHLEALPAAERVGRYRDTIRQVLQLVERQEVRASTGLTDAQMAARQATFMDAEALADAQAATGSAAPSAADVQQAQQLSTAQLSLPSRATNRWSALPSPPDPAQADFRARAATAVARIVARAAVVAPELGITAARMHFDPVAIDGAADTRYAEYDRRNNRLNFGMDFTDAAMADADYVVGTVVHEVFGHGEHGGIGDDYALQIFTAARPLTTMAYSAAERAAAPSSSDRFGFGYQGTEIYSELREAQFVVAAPSGAGVVQGDMPANDVRRRVGLIKDKWEADVARGLLRGMYARFALDPRITPAVLQLYVDAVDHHYPGENLLAARP